jgi:hypothetical protein
MKNGGKWQERDMNSIEDYSILLLGTALAGLLLAVASSSRILCSNEKGLSVGE